MNSIYIKYFRLLCVLLSFTSYVIAQQNHNHTLNQTQIAEKLKGVQLVFDQDSLNGFDELAAQEKAAKTGAESWEQIMYLSLLKRQFITNKYSSYTNSFMSPPPPTVQAPCTNVDFETGDYSGWTVTEGVNNNSSSMGGCCSSASTRVTVMTGGTDPIGGFPIVPPGVGNNVLMIGDGSFIGGYAVRVSQTFQVTAANAVFIYRYAAVLQDGGAGHSCAEQPYFNVSFKTASGASIPCGDIDIIYGCSSGQSGWTTTGGVSYKPWTIAAFDLTAYIGQNVTIEFTASDCTLGGHYGYAYIDASCQPMTLTLNGNPIPTGQTNNYLCQGSNNTLCAPPGYNYSWSGPGVTGQTGQCVTVNSQGSYSVNLSIPGSSCLNPQLSSNFTYTPAPIADFTYSVSSCQSTLLVPVTDNSNINGGASISSYTWDWGDGTTTTGASSSHVYASTGGQSIELKIQSSAGCTDSVTKNITIFNKPTASFTMGAPCVSAPTTFNSTSTPTVNIAAQVWSYGDGGVGSGTQGTHTYSTANTYPVKLVVIDLNGCKDSITQNLIVNPKPLISFSGTNVCLGQNTVFTNNSSVTSPSTISNWYWDFDNNGVVDNTTQAPTYTYTSSGTQTVELKAITSGGCSDSLTTTVNINPTPTINFSPTNSCIFTNVVLNNSTSVSAPDNIVLYNWQFGTGSSVATSSNPTPTNLSYTSSGVKTITLTASTNNFCSATQTSTVMIHPQPVASFTATSACLNQSTNYTDQSTGGVNGWMWDYTNDGSVDASIPNPSNTYATSGTYTTALIVSSINGCRDTMLLPITVWGRATVDFTPTNVCYGSAINFADLSQVNAFPNTGNIQGWQWNFGNGGTSIIQNPSYTFTNTIVTDTQYPVKLVVTTSHGCKDSLTKQVTVHTTPIADFTSDSVCLGNFSTLTDISQGLGHPIIGYAWDFDQDGFPDNTTTANPSEGLMNFGNNLVTLAIFTNPSTNLFCRDTVQKNVWVRPTPNPDFTFNNACVNAQPISFNGSNTSIATGGISSYAWSFGDGQNGTGLITNHNYVNAGIYTAQLTVTDNTSAQCQNSITYQLEVYPKPIVGISTLRACEGQALNVVGNELPGSGFVVLWNWDFNNTLSSYEASGPTASYVYNTSGTRTITVVSISDHNCMDTTSKIVFINPVPFAQFSVDDPDGCPLPHCVNFTDNSIVTGSGNIVNWTWNFGDGNSAIASTNATQNHCYNNTSSSQLAKYTVQLVVKTDSMCVDTQTYVNMITVFPKPIAQFDVAPSTADVIEPLIYYTNKSEDYIQWVWYFGDATPIDSVNNNTSHFYNSVIPTTYETYLMVKNQYGCLDTTQKPITISPGFVFYIPNAFTPNYDNVNNTFTGQGIGIADYEMWIFDRWDNMIYYTKDINRGWDGRSKGQSDAVLQDVYIWKVRLTDVFGKRHDYLGHVTVIK